MKLASWDGGDIWYLQMYDLDTTMSIDNSGFIKFNPDIEVGDANVYNTTSSRLWSKVLLLLLNDIKTTYAEMRQNGLSMDNIVECIIEDQIDKIPATFYNKDMQTKYLDFGNTYLYALHGSDKEHMKLWIEERLLYLDTLWDYDASVSDFVSLRSSKLGNIYMDIETFRTMYLKVKWRNDTTGASTQKLRVVKNGEPTRFTFSSKTNTDQEIRIYGGQYIKSLGDLSNLEPTTITLVKAPKVNSLICHSDKLINTDASSCVNLSRVDLSGCTNLGSGTASLTSLDVTGCTELKYLNIQNTALQGVQLNPKGSNIKEIWYPKSIQTISLTNCPQLTTVGLMQGHSCKELTLINCPKVETFGDREYQISSNTYTYANSYFLSGVQNMTLNNSALNMKYVYIPEAEIFGTFKFISMPNLKYVILGQTDYGFKNSTNVIDYDISVIKNKGTTKIITLQCPKLKTFCITALATKFEKYMFDEEIYNDINKNKYLETNYNSAKENNRLFMSNILDLSEFENLESVKLCSCSWIYNINLPLSVKEILINLFRFSDCSINYYGNILWNGSINIETFIDSSKISDSWQRTQRFKCKYMGFMINSITTSTSREKYDTLESLNNIWDFEGLNLINADFYGFNSGVGKDNMYHYPGVILDSYKINIKNLNLKPKEITPPWHDYWVNSIQGTVDFSEFTGKSLCYAMAYFNDNNVKLTPPNGLGNAKYYNGMLYNINTQKIKWNDDITIAYLNGITSSSYAQNITLQEQTDYETDGVIITNNTAKSWDKWFNNCNIKYLKELNLPNTTASSSIISGAPNLIKIGTINTPKLTGVPGGIVTNCKSLKELSLVILGSNVDSANYISAFSNLNLTSDLKIVGDIAGTNFLRYSTVKSLDLSEARVNGGLAYAFTSFNCKEGKIILNGKCTNLSTTFSGSNIPELDMTNLDLSSCTTCQSAFSSATIGRLTGFNTIPDSAISCSNMFNKSNIKDGVIPKFNASSSKCNSISSMFQNYKGSVNIPNPFIVPAKVTSNLTFLFDNINNFSEKFTLDCSNMEYMLYTVDWHIFKNTRGLKDFTFIVPPYTYYKKAGTEATNSSSYFFGGYNGNTNELEKLKFDFTNFKGTKLGTNSFLGVNELKNLTIENIDFNLFGYSNIGGNKLFINNFTVHGACTDIDIDIRKWRMSYENYIKFVDEVISALDCANLLTPMSYYDDIKYYNGSGISTWQNIMTDFIPVKSSSKVIMKVNDILNNENAPFRAAFYKEDKTPTTEGSSQSQISQGDWNNRYGESGREIFIPKTAHYIRVGFTGNNNQDRINKINNRIKEDLVSLKYKTPTQTPKTLTMGGYTNFDGTTTLTQEQKETIISKATPKGWNIVFG